MQRAVHQGLMRARLVGQGQRPKEKRGMWRGGLGVGIKIRLPLGIAAGGIIYKSWHLLVFIVWKMTGLSVTASC